MLKSDRFGMEIMLVLMVELVAVGLLKSDRFGMEIWHLFVFSISQSHYWLKSDRFGMEIFLFPQCLHLY